ncbi:beta-1,3-N-acetylglucosaminyltransferase radical fringe [Latimeria chalumnae]|uniref:O-fucosylpeptide 3-beta-N-acetylglucosaminyltransferase n=1 Tax=Latimeria chalumnae TaxID=7897 RepID=H3AWV1_LATCH|nr:PREDICTED: beta-1,3-N-acetylglucosaminyltransferase radical fringe [Latimeria chalumnae]|eukprot:XP_005989124.1 PREDICTED: beta-1,3-N-acetylglucosaminyltransferase radical fringe [Latimeria chalumnae]
MTFSQVGVSKLCFLLSITFCTLLLLLIPSFQPLWKSGDSLQPRPPPPANGTWERASKIRQTDPRVVKLLLDDDHIDAVKQTLIELEDGELEKWERYNHGTVDLDGNTEGLEENSSSRKSMEAESLMDYDREELQAAVEKEKVELEDIFIAVKTTRKYHKSRLSLLFQTWISRAKEQTFIFTDGEDKELRQEAGDHMINTNCSAVHTRQALCCKMSVEYDKFIESGKKWFCHVDDDNYVNPISLLRLLSSFSHSQDVYLGRPSLDHPIEAADRLKADGYSSVKFWFATGGAGFCISRGLALKMSPWASLGNFISTAERVRLPDDCTIGYIIEALLEVKLIRCVLFHSHLENLQRLPSETIIQQVTLSYGGMENRHNVISIGGAFSLQEDPTRFRSVHCLLYPDTSWCPKTTKT